MAEKTHWKRLQNPDYIGVYSVSPPKSEPILTISKITRATVMGENGRKEEETIAHFVEKSVDGLPEVKPMILNVTNQKAIEKAHGTPYIEDWGGKKIQLTVRREKAFGEMMDVLRIKTVPPKQDEIPTVTCADCGQGIVGQGQVTADQIIAGTKKTYGAALCMDCATKRKEAADAAKSE